MHVIIHHYFGIVHGWAKVMFCDGWFTLENTRSSYCDLFFDLELSRVIMLRLFRRSMCYKELWLLALILVFSMHGYSNFDIELSNQAGIFSNLFLVTFR